MLLVIFLFGFWVVLGVQQEARRESKEVCFGIHRAGRKCLKCVLSFMLKTMI